MTFLNYVLIPFHNVIVPQYFLLFRLEHFWFREFEIFEINKKFLDLWWWFSKFRPPRITFISWHCSNISLLYFIVVAVKIQGIFCEPLLSEKSFRSVHKKLDLQLCRCSEVQWWRVCSPVLEWTSCRRAVCCPSISNTYQKTCIVTFLFWVMAHLRSYFFSFCHQKELCV